MVVAQETIQYKLEIDTTTQQSVGYVATELSGLVSPFPKLLTETSDEASTQSMGADGEPGMYYMLWEIQERDPLSRVSLGSEEALHIKGRPDLDF